MELVRETICYISRADVVDIFKGIASKAKARLWKYIEDVLYFRHSLGKN